MKDWIVDIEQKKKSSKQSKRTERRKKASGIETKKSNRNTLENAVKYLLNDKHNRHALTNITDLGNARLVRDNILDEYDLMREKHGKGVSNVASSFCLSIPADLYHPSVEEWEKIYNSTIENFVNRVNKDLEKKEKALDKVDLSSLSARQLKEHNLNIGRYAQRLDIDEVKKLATAVIHDDREKPLIVGKTNGSHLNIVLSNIHNGEVIKYISQKGGVNAMKKAYNQAVKKHLGLDCKYYIPYNSRPDDEKLKKFYTAKTDLNLVQIDENTPHKDKLNKSPLKDPDEYTRTEPYWLINQKKSIELQNDKDKLDQEKSKAEKLISQAPKAKKLIKTANTAIQAKKKAVSEKNDVVTETKTQQDKLNQINQKIGVSEKRLKKVNKHIKNNEQWLYKVIKSDIVQKRIETLRELTNHSMEFYVSVKRFIKGLNNQNEEFLKDLEQQNPQWLKREKERLEREEQLKQERIKNRHSGNEFTEEIELIDELKQETQPEIKFDDYEPEEDKKQKKKKRFGFF